MQLHLWDEFKEVPNVIETALQMGAVLVASESGGKDSQAMLKLLLHLKETRKWPGSLVAVHAHLGRIEWLQTLPHVEQICSNTGVDLTVVQRKKGDLIDRWRERYEELKRTGEEKLKPFWSSSLNRYCTSDLKRTPIDKFLRQFPFVVCAIGLRSSESIKRAKEPQVKVRFSITTKRLQNLDPDTALSLWTNNPTGRLALNWNPILHFDLEQVWQWCGTSTAQWNRRRKLPDDEALDGWPAHPAYVLGHGNERLSCSFCILGSESDLRNAIAYNRETYSILVSMEDESGWSFQHKRSLLSLSS
jgi:3'-phosphoadenosine 5'-phosphosulfate sulfotransferase (PAPS reductase)/FAD synthetase